MANSANYVNRITDRRAKRKKKQKRGLIVKTVSMVIVLYLVLFVFFSFRSGVSTTIALNGTVKEEIVADGYVFREQFVINAPVGGYLECMVNDGERVKEDQLLGRIYTGEYDPERSQKILELNDRIARLENDDSADTYAGNSVMVDQRIGIVARDLSDLRTERDIRNLVEQKEEVNLLIEKKNSIDATVDKASLLQTLKGQLVELENGIVGTKTELLAPAAGVFCSRIDGLEEELGFDDVDGISVSYLKKLDKEPLETNEEVIQGEPVCKVVNNYGWYFSANIDKTEAERLQIGQSIRLRFFDHSDTIVYGVVRGISPEEGGNVAITIYTNRYVEGIYGMSRISAEIIIVSSEGIKVPVESLHVQGDQTGVYVLRLGVARFVPINVHYKNGEWAIISPVTDSSLEYRLQIYDEVIVKAKKLEDGKVVR